MRRLMKKRPHVWLYYLFVAVMFVIVLSHSNEGNNDRFEEIDCIPFSDDWEYEFGDGISGMTKLPNDLPKANSDTLILKKKLPCIDKKESLIFKVRHADVKIYVDGELRAESKGNRKEIGNYYKEVFVHPNDSGKEVIIEQKCDLKRYQNSPGGVYLGDRGSFFLNILKTKWKTIMFTILLILLSVVLFILWIIDTLVLKYESMEVLCLALFSAGVSLWLFTESDFAQFLLNDTAKVSLLAYEVLMLIPVPIALFFSFYSDRIRGRIASDIAAIIPLIVFVVNNILEVTDTLQLADTLIITQIVLAFEIVYIAVIQITEIMYKYREKEKYNSTVWKIPLLGIAILVPLATLEVVKYMFFATKAPNDGVMISMGVFFYMLSLAIDSVVRMNYRAEKFKETSEVKTQFLANMSHEIRTPLNAILGFNEAILRTSNEEKVKDYAVDIQQAGENLKTIINSILDISKIESGKLELYSVEYSTVQMFNQVVSIFETMAKKKGLDFYTDIDSRVPAVLIGDENHIFRVIVNLMSNAVKYTDKGSITFTVRLEEMSEELPICKLYVSVKDTGIGIKQEDRDRLFEKFERLDRDKNYSTEGTGLGMSIVVQLLKAMGSEIEFESEYGQGSDFHFTITQSVVSEEKIGSFIERRKEIALANSECNDFIAPDAKVLIVDDVQMNIDAAAALLEPLQVQISTAKSGKEAIEMVKKDRFNIVLMDHMMPEMDGVQATEAIRNLAVENEDVYYAELPILALTANAMVGMKESFFMAGMQDFISKPIEVNVLYKAIEKWLPKELKKKVSEEDILKMKAKQSKEENEEWEKLPECIDVSIVMQYCSTYDLFERNIKNYCSTCEQTSKKLLEFKEQNDADNYKIAVHGLKSTSKMIGLTIVSDMALDQEEKCQEGRGEEAFAKTEKLVSLYKKCVSYLQSYLDEKYRINDSESDEEVCSDEDYQKLLNRIKTAASEFDMGAFIELEQEMDEIRVADDKKEEFEKLKVMVINASFGDVKDFFESR